MYSLKVCEHNNTPEKRKCQKHELILDFLNLKGQHDIQDKIWDQQHVYGPPAVEATPRRGRDTAPWR